MNQSDNLWQSVMDAVVHQLDCLKVSENSPKYPSNPARLPRNRRQAANKLLAYIRIPNTGFAIAIVLVVDRACRQYDIIESDNVPALFVSWGPCRLDNEAPAPTDVIVEQLGILIEAVFREGCGSPKRGTIPDTNRQDNEAATLNEQVSGIRHDLHKVLQPSQLLMAANFPPRTEIRDAKIVEWNTDPDYRGTPQEVVGFMLQVTVAYDRRYSRRSYNAGD